MLAALVASAGVASAADTSTTAITAISLAGVPGFFVPSKIFRELDADSVELEIRLDEISALREQSKQLKIAIIARTESSSAAIQLADTWRENYAAEVSRSEWPITKSREFWTGIGFVFGAAAAIGIAHSVPR